MYSDREIETKINTMRRTQRDEKTTPVKMPGNKKNRHHIYPLIVGFVLLCACGYIRFIAGTSDFESVRHVELVAILHVMAAYIVGAIYDKS